VLGGKIGDKFALGEKQRARKHDDGISAVAGHRGESAVELVGCPHLYELKFNGEGPRRRLRRLQHVSRRALAESAGMPKRSDAGNIGQRLLEQTETLGDNLRAEKRQACDVPARPRERSHEPVFDRVAHDRHDDWDRAGCTLDRAGRRRVGGEDEVQIERGELIRQLREVLDPAICRAIFDDDALPST
jgi:hypothetical protein